MAYTQELETRRLYRSRHGWLFGVCRGLAEYFNLSVGWTRFLVFLTFVFTGLWPVGALYLLAALLMKREPYVPFEVERPARHGRHACRREGTAEHEGARVTIEARLRNLEDIVTDPRRDWDARLNAGR